MTFQSFGHERNLPPAMSQRIQDDCVQIMQAGYPNTINLENNRANIQCDITVQDINYRVVWQCSMLYPAEPPQCIVWERGYDSYAQIQDSQIIVIVPQLNVWTPNTLLLELMQEVHRRLESKEFARIAPDNGHQMHNYIANKTVHYPSDFSDLREIPPLPQPETKQVPLRQPSLVVHRPLSPIVWFVGSGIFILLIILVITLIVVSQGQGGTADAPTLPSSSQQAKAISTNTPMPTNTPELTNTPMPTNTPTPITINPASVGNLSEWASWEAHGGDVNNVTFSPDGKLLASASDDTTVKLWRVADQMLIHTLQGHTERVFNLSFSPDEQTLASCSQDDTVKLWNVQNGNLQKTLNPKSGDAYDIAFSPDGQTLSIALQDKTVQLWNLANDTSRALQGHTDRVFTVAFSSDGQWLATGGGDNTARLWKFSDGTLLHTFEGHTVSVSDIAFSSDNQWLITASVDKTVRIWQISDGMTIHTLEGSTGPVWYESLSSDGQLLATSSDDQIVRIWDVHEGKLLKELKGHLKSVLGVAFSPDGQTLATSSVDKTIRLWKLKGK